MRNRCECYIIEYKYKTKTFAVNLINRCKLIKRITVRYMKERSSGNILSAIARRFNTAGISSRKRYNSPNVRYGSRYIPQRTSRASLRRNKSSFRSFRIRDKRVFIIAAASAAVVIAGIILVVVFTSGGQPAAMANNGLLPEQTKPLNVTLAVPAFAPLSISEGVSASVVTDVQQRLMELGYMDEDVPDGLYSGQTLQAVKHFQRQESLDISGTIDQQTYDLLVSPGAPEYTISVGAQDSESDVDVSGVQQRLCELGYIPEEGVTGNYSEDTKAAVEKFQKLNSLDTHGSADKHTRELLYSDEAIANYYSPGEKSDEVLIYQQKLKELGYLQSEPDGNYGPNTKSAVKRFQQSSGLIADGFIGPQTAEALMNSDAQINALCLGAKGDDVKKIQERLKALKYLSSSAAIDGNFGPGTDNALRSFQHNNGLAADGKVGPKTNDLLFSDKAKKSTGVNISGPNVSSLISVAKSKRGCKYVRGGKGPSVFDCSGFVYWCLKQVGVKQGYLTSAGWANSSKYKKITSMGSLRRGDIIVYEGHVTICLGGGYQIEASSGKGKVVERKYTGSSYWSSTFICGFRIF